MKKWAKLGQRTIDAVGSNFDIACNAYGCIRDLALYVKGTFTLTGGSTSGTFIEDAALRFLKRVSVLLNNGHQYLNPTPSLVLYYRAKAVQGKAQYYTTALTGAGGAAGYAMVAWIPLIGGEDLTKALDANGLQAMQVSLETATRDEVLSGCDRTATFSGTAKIFADVWKGAHPLPKEQQLVCKSVFQAETLVAGTEKTFDAPTPSLTDRCTIVGFTSTPARGEAQLGSVTIEYGGDPVFDPMEEEESRGAQIADLDDEAPVDGVRVFNLADLGQQLGVGAKILQAKVTPAANGTGWVLWESWVPRAS